MPYFQPPTQTHHWDSIILGVKNLWEIVVALFMGVEDHQKGEVDLWEGMVDPQAEADQ
jgi:hypothetical protein